jgi:phosphoglucomutase
MAIAFADKIDAPLIFANDPDADRFCAAERSASGEWHIFTGNEMGIILASHVLKQYKSRSNFDLSTSTSSITD